MTLRLSLASLLLLAACAEEPVRRAVVLEPVDGLPTATSAVAGDRLHLNIARLEPLAAGHVLVAWARKADKWNALGAVAPGRSAIEVDGPGKIDELLVTKEASATPVSPSTVVIFRGPPAGALSFGGLGGPTLEAISGASVHVEGEDATLVVEAEGMPVLGAGTSWGVWLHRSPMPEMPEMEPERTYLGKLEGHSATFTAARLVAEHQEVVVAVELDDGATGQGSIVLRGKLLGTDNTAPEEDAAAHQH